MKDILLVEDNEELAVLIRDFLIREGYSVCWAVSGKEALEVMEEQPI